MQSLEEIDQITIREYTMRMLAFNLSQIDRLAEIAQQAWLNQQASVVDKNGKSPFKEFKDFFDYDTALKSVYKPQKPEKEMNQTLVKIAKRLQKYQQQKGG